MPSWGCLEGEWRDKTIKNTIANIQIMRKLPLLPDITKEKRRIYEIELKINNQVLTQLIIDPHYELKRSGYVNDELIYNLVLALNDKRFVPKSRKSNWEYFETDLIYQNKSYFLV
jgi:hypothetical protein